MIAEIEPKECAEHLSEYKIIDVRTQDEYENDYGHIEGAECYTLQDVFQEKVKELDKDKKYLFVCRSGRRSLFAAEIAINHGINDVTNLIGGMMAWSEQGLPVVKP